MSSEWLMVVKDARDAKTVSSEISIQNQSASDVNNNDPDAWAYLRDLSSYFAAGSAGATSLKVMVTDGAVAAAGTITLSGFTSADTITIGDQTFGATGGILGAASTFGLLAGTAITNTGATTIAGDIGVQPAGSISGFPPGTFTGTSHNGDATSLQAHNDATNAVAALDAVTPIIDISATDLGGFTATPGHYDASSSGTWSAGNLTLNGAGTYIFTFDSSLTMPASANVVLTGGATADKVYFITGTTFTFGANDTVNGNILAGTSITFASLSVLNGRALTYGPSATTITFPSAGTVVVPASGPTPNTFTVGATDTITAANAAAAIDANPAYDCVLTAMSSGPVITITSLIPGLVGNLIPISISGGGTASGPFLTGGTQAGCGDVEEGIGDPLS
jgi:hypothetical protein